jgi:hypothetical protein
VIIERALADSDLGRDGVDADGADAVQIKQPVGGLQDPLLHVDLVDGFFGWRHLHRPVYIQA